MSPPNANTITESTVPDPPPVVVLYIKAPFAVIVAVENVESAKSVKAVVPLVVGSTLVKVFPPAE